MVGSRHPFAGLALGSNVPPVPISAVWTGGLPGSLAVTFDQPLVPGALSAFNWIAIHANWIWSFSAAVAAGSVVTLTPVQGIAGPPTEVLQFDPPPDDVVDAITGLPAVAFTDFPIT